LDLPLAAALLAGPVEARGGWILLRKLPNAVTLTRLGLVPALVVLALLRWERPFATILIGCLAGDILDGQLARALHAASELGARLDSLADTLLFFAAAYGAWAFHGAELSRHLVAFLLVPGLWAAENLAALFRYGRLSSFHTYLSRAAAYALGVLAGSLFWFGLYPWLLWLALSIFMLATLEELVLLLLLPRWTADVRGLYWVLRGQRPAPDR